MSNELDLIMLMKCKKKELKVLIISEDAFYFMGIRKILNDYFNDSLAIKYQLMSEKTFASGLSEVGGLSLQIEAPIAFAGDYSYKKIYKHLKCKQIKLFGTQHKPSDVLKSLINIDLNVSHKLNIPAIYELLSNKEELIYLYMKNGFTDDQIANLMLISKKTISSHRGHILKKLGYRNKIRMFTKELDFTKELLC